jgi:2-polyprenyl-3-methyl-5-hydroxy-6-metoxy-1,4-benzoquinol methylase
MQENLLKPLDMHSEFMNVNKEMWNKKTPIHVKSKFYDNELFLSGKNSLTEIDLQYLPEVENKRLIHLQCHFGQDTLSLERMGASCVGIDFSEIAIDQAKEMAQGLNLKSNFYVSNVYDTLALNLGKFDIVFTSYGVLAWLPELDSWAKIVSELLVPGGIFYIAEFHPMLYMFEFEKQELQFPYFNAGLAFKDEEHYTYTDHNQVFESVSYFWQHSLDETMMALMDNGMEIIRFKEFDYSPYDCFPHMKEIGHSRYQYGATELKIPHIFHILAKKR